MRNYKFSYLGYFALNVALVIALLVIRGLDVDAPGLLGIIEHSIVFWGVSMILFLCSKVFKVTDDYTGVGTLNGHTTISLALVLALVEFMAVYYSMFGHEALYHPTIVGLCVWVACFLSSVFYSKNLISRRKEHA